MPFDAITLWISQLNFPLLTFIAQLIDSDLLFLAIILLLVIVSEKGKRRNTLFVTIVLLYMVGFGLKYLVREMRPCDFMPSKVMCPSSYSFPSSHAVVAFALAAGLRKKKTGWLYALFAVFVVFTRIYLGVHTLFDVIGGAIIGAGGYLVIEAAWERVPDTIKKPLSPYLE